MVLNSIAVRLRTPNSNVSSLFCLQIAELSEMRDKIMSRVSTAVEQAARYRDSYNEYAYLWVDDRKVFLNQFLKYGHVLTQVHKPH